MSGHPKLVHLARTTGTVGKGQVALVPGDRAPSLMLDVPRGLKGAARERVARRQIADRIGPGAHVHVHPLRAPAMPDWRQVLVADPTDMADWRARCDAGCVALLPDYLGLPFAPGMWSVAMQDDKVLLRHAVDAGFAAEPALAVALIGKLDGPQPAAILRQGDLPPEVGAALTATGARVVDTLADAQNLKLDPRTLGHGELGFDLRRDADAARHDLRRALRPWLVAACLALIAAGLYATALTYDARRIENRVAVARVETDAIVRDLFVPSGPILDPRVQVSRVLSDLRASAATDTPATDPLLRLGRLFDALAAAAPEIRQVTLAPDQRIEVTMTVPDFAAADRIVADLTAAGLPVAARNPRLSDTGAVDVAVVLEDGE